MGLALRLALFSLVPCFEVSVQSLPLAFSGYGDTLQTNVEGIYLSF